ncbi:MAG TPA: sulfatase [Bryobacteraceae bacterium]|nr:sulfatase [Bryobacteraceae bacterium]
MSSTSDQDSTLAETRRQFLQTGLAATTLLPHGGRAQSTGSPRRPNIVFMLGEGQRADALSLAGNRLLQTPNHDRIGREGVYFRNAFVTNALCAPAPARAVILTGMHSHSTGALGNNTRNPLPSSIPLFTDLLQQAGYEIALCGKAHVGNGVRERKWDYYLGYNAPGTNYYHPVFWEGSAGNIAGPHTYSGYADDVVTDHAINWLKQKRERPFCLLLWWTAPHAPFYRARRHLDLYNGVPIPKPDTFDDDLKGYPGKPRAFANADNKIGTTILGGDDPRSLEELVKDYYAGLVDIDENIGRVLDCLSELGQLDDTVVLNTSDHGFFLGEWRMYDKRFMHEPSIRVPTTIRYPKLFQAGRLVDEMVLEMDIAPTLLELAGVNIPANMQGRSFVNLAQGQEQNWRKDWLYEYYEYPASQKVRPHRGVRTDRYKFIHYYMEPEEFEVYDLKTDPGEKNNLHGKPEYADLTRALQNRLLELRRETKDPALNS